MPSKKHRNQRARKGGGARRSGLERGGPSYHVTPGPTRYRPFPSELNFSSKYSNRSNVGASTQYQIQFGITEFMTRLPLYTAQMYTIYEWCRLRRVDIRVSFTNTTALTGVTVTLAAFPFNQQASATVDQLMEGKSATWKLAGVSTGDSSVTLTRSWDVEKTVGVPFFDKSHWINVTQANTFTPVDQNELQGVINIGANSTQAWTGFLDFQITYHMQFFSPLVPRAPQLREVLEEGSDESLDDTVVLSNPRGKSIVLAKPKLLSSKRGREN